MKDLLLGFLIGGIIGLWVGVNLGKDQPITANPFAEKSSMKEFNKQIDELQESVSKKSQELYNDSKKAVDEAF
ncbi:MAG: hypothetical protein KZQ64_02855 [gamma proteobacterium symbiont of Bathyaustriella thionipta]|nr:hypothetical protein [gamma proteobacterium symbiont of Bathyaustriella thionipta]MCU7949544.1 hypothetical protein [gamma proteobacterium symbiont of Bathyaustriella thionipta]MCU7952326.1 hypothetical protein [gamma proteobacterium symbiont of Bathyaustriella thionipta]MCU7956144.1 hypothetical protein [gamma proteobacterium symbiont of Bathyaustriella thionipta]MCU7967153.1 hypothetical protein [gamma proteobacterium symbiont of Bathyaustriella thionipta]